MGFQENGVTTPLNTHTFRSGYTNTNIFADGRGLQKTAEAVEAYHRREDMKSLVSLKATRKVADGAPDLDKEPPVFKNGGSLRDYQREVMKGDNPTLRERGYSVSPAIVLVGANLLHRHYSGRPALFRA